MTPDTPSSRISIFKWTNEKRPLVHDGHPTDKVHPSKAVRGVLVGQSASRRECACGRAVDGRSVSSRASPSGSAEPMCRCVSRSTNINSGHPRFFRRDEVQTYCDLALHGMDPTAEAEREMPGHWHVANNAVGALPYSERRWHTCDQNHPDKTEANSYSLSAAHKSGVAASLPGYRS